MPSQDKRTLKIEVIGDFASSKTKPLIRLTGQWLERAGFKPGNRVAVHLPKSGELTLQAEELKPTELV